MLCIGTKYIFYGKTISLLGLLCMCMYLLLNFPDAWHVLVFSIHDHHDAHHTMYFVSAYKCVLWMDGKFVSSGSNFCEMSIYVFICAHFKFPEHPVKTTGRRYELSQPAKIYLLSKSKKKRPPEAKKGDEWRCFLKRVDYQFWAKLPFYLT